MHSLYLYLQQQVETHGTIAVSAAIRWGSNENADAAAALFLQQRVRRALMQTPCPTCLEQHGHHAVANADPLSVPAWPSGAGADAYSLLWLSTAT